MKAIFFLKQSAARLFALTLCGTFFIPCIACNGEQKSLSILALSAEEKEWLNAHKGKITLSPCPDYPPIDFTDEKGNHTGLAADYMQKIESLLNFKFVIAHQDDWHTVMEKARHYEIDGVISIQRTPEREEFLLFTEPFVQIPNIIVARNNDKRKFVLPAMKNMKICAVKGYAVTNYLMKKYPYLQFQLEPNELTCLMNVSFSVVDAAIVSLSSASYYIEEKGITNLRVAGNVEYDWKLAIATRKDMPILNKLLNRALSHISQSEREKMYRRWISLKSDTELVIKEVILAIGIFSTVILLGIAVVLFWNKMLRREVQLRTMALNYELAERKKAERTLAAEKEKLLVMLKSIGDGVISIDMGGRILLMNTIAGELTGWNPDDAINKNITDIFILRDKKTNEIIPFITEKIDTTHNSSDVLLVRRDGSARTILLTCSQVRDETQNAFAYILVFRDITERLRVEEELNKIQKLESLGVLSGGIAHDFNNILTAILGNANLIEFYIAQRNHTNENEKLLKILKEIEKATLRAKDLTNQLLTFSKGGKPLKKLGDLRKVLTETVVFALRGTNVSAEFIIKDEFFPAEFDEAQISQVFHNLTINAHQAMPAGGTITIRAEQVDEKWETHNNRKKGKYIKIDFIDRGIGIPAENLSKIFDPFFTTKEKGSGLGLTSAFSIIRMHDGYIDVVSTPNKGSMFTVYIPVAKMLPQNVETEKSPHIHHATGTILIMDDEEAIRDTLKGMLEYLGYRVISASHGEEAISVYKDALKHGISINAVILDLTIPGGIGGRDTIRMLKEINPGVKAIAISGYSQSEEIGNYLEYGFATFVPKPFRMEDVSDALYSILYS
ncbi:MAG: transporter substrate-binding domain-containing protein [Spirochaetes bacterium]|nr:transporter substrate-binding domain-containing protein [Spirochaetota bacterium]